MRVLVVCTFAITLVVLRAIAFAQAPVRGVGPDILGVRTGMAPQDVTKIIERQRPVRTCESTPHGSSYKLSCVARTMRDTTSGASSGSLEILVAKDLKASGLVIEVARQIFGGNSSKDKQGILDRHRKQYGKECAKEENHQLGTVLSWHFDERGRLAPVKECYGPREAIGCNRSHHGIYLQIHDENLYQGMRDTDEFSRMGQGMTVMVINCTLAKQANLGVRS